VNEITHLFKEKSRIWAKFNYQVVLSLAKSMDLMMRTYMRRKPDILVVLALIFAIGVVVSNYSMGGADPEALASEFAIR
jgi:uncharacterized membrane protein YoaK (UPF0700 family)